MIDTDLCPANGTPIPDDLHARRADILRIGNRAVAAVQASNRQRGILNWYSLGGRLVSDTPLPASSAAGLLPTAST